MKSYFIEHSSKNLGKQCSIQQMIQLFMSCFLCVGGWPWPSLSPIGNITFFVEEFSLKDLRACGAKHHCPNIYL